MKTFLVCFCSLAAALSLCAEETTPAQALQTVVENEGKFFQLGQEKGTKTAFLTYLADDAIVFQPGPTNGRKVWEKKEGPGISIVWKPLFAAIASSADLAYTTGPAEFRKKKDDEKPIGYGQFISIWKKQKDGSWKVALDTGSELPGASKSGEPEELELSPSPEDAKPRDHAAAEKTLHAAEAKFDDAAKADSTIALSEASSPEVRVHRDGVFPAIGKGAATLMLSVRRGKLSHDRLGGGRSEAGDLAYTYGKYSLKNPEKTETGYYLQIWRTQADASWKVTLDYESPLPPEKKK
ncbi:MAG: YybH family protein [Chthoniobacterales bacterium]